MKIGVIGAGKAGSALALALCESGHRIAGVADRDRERAAKLGRSLPAPVLSNAEIVATAEVVLLAVPDAAIGAAASALAAEIPAVGGRTFLHLSGAHPSSLLRPLAPNGALGSLHPLLALAGESSHERLHECYYAFEGEPAAEAVAREIVASLGGRFFTIRAGDKVLYHAAAVIAANYLVSLVDTALGLYRQIGLPEREAMEAVLPLVRGTVANLAEMGPEAALTGPISRGDLATIGAHLRELAGADPRAAEVHRAMGRVTVSLAERAGRLDHGLAREIGELLEGDEGDG